MITVGGDLWARYCIHAVGPDYAEERESGRTLEQCDELLKNPYLAALTCAANRTMLDGPAESVRVLSTEPFSGFKLT